MSLKKLPEISEHVKNQFVNSVKKHHNGVKWRALKQELENALIYYIEVGPLSEHSFIPAESSGDVEKHKMSKDEFFKIFDNEHIYPYDKIEADYFKGMVFKITEHESDPNWRKWSKIVRESGRLIWLRGSKHYKVNRTHFEFIDPELKASYDLAIKQRQLDSYSVQEDHATRIYKKLIPGKITNLKDICKIGGIPEKEGKKVIDTLMVEYKLQLVQRGSWRVLDPAAARTLKENSLYRSGD
jgi:hypothetical protein